MISIKSSKIMNSIFIACILLVVAVVGLTTYFSPKPFKSIFEENSTATNGLAYITFFDISNYASKDMSVQVTDLLEPSDDALWSLLDNVFISGPVLYANGAANAELVNLYVSLPQQDGSYSSTSIEFMLYYGADFDDVSVFINVDNKGYIVASDDNSVAEFINVARNESM